MHSAAHDVERPIGFSNYGNLRTFLDNWRIA